MFSVPLRRGLGRLSTQLQATRLRKIACFSEMNGILAQTVFEEFQLPKTHFLIVWKRRLQSYKTLKNVVGDSVGHQPCIRECTAEQFLVDSLLEAGVDRENISKSFILSALEKYYEPEIKKIKIKDGAFEILDHFKEGGYKLAMVTNCKDTLKQHILLEQIKFQDYFSEIVISSEIGYRKPDSRIFQPILDKWNVHPSRIAMIGDMLNRDILGASRIGMRSVWLKEPHRHHIVDPEIQIDKVITKLIELPEAIESMGDDEPPPHELIVIGYHFPEKKIRKFTRQGMFQDLYRDDVRYVQIDRHKPLEEQESFHIILHKCTDLMVKKGDEKSVDSLQNLRNYCKAHPEVCVVEPIDFIYPITNRFTIHELIDSADLRAGSGLRKVRSPKCVRGTVSELTEMDWSKFGFPVICKNIVANGYPAAHQMAIIARPQDLKDLDKSVEWLVQQYINHDAVIYKVYVLGSETFVYPKESLPNVFEDFEEIVHFNSADPVSSEMMEQIGGTKYQPPPESTVSGILQSPKVTSYNPSLPLEFPSSLNLQASFSQHGSPLRGSPGPPLPRAVEWSAQPQQRFAPVPFPSLERDSDDEANNDASGSETIPLPDPADAESQSPEPPTIKAPMSEDLPEDEDLALIAFSQASTPASSVEIGLEDSDNDDDDTKLSELSEEEIHHLVQEFAPTRRASDFTTLHFVFGIAEGISEQLRNILELNLFGYDLLVEHKSGELFIVDINYFPSYKGVEDFDSKLLQFLLVSYGKHKEKNKSN